MKKTEDYVCTLEQAKRLRELGVEQDSIHYWKIHKKIPSYKDLVTPRKWEKKERRAKEIGLGNLFAAFTSQELGELICETLLSVGCDHYHVLMEGSCGNNYLFSFDAHATVYERLNKTDKGLPVFDDAEFQSQYGCGEDAKAYAEFLIYLLEQKNEKI